MLVSALIFIVIVTVIAAGIFVYTQKKVAKDDFNVDDLKTRLNYLQQGFAHQGALETRDDIGESPFNKLLNHIASLLPAPSPEKLELLNKAGLRSPDAYKAKVTEQIGTTILGVVVGLLIGIAMNNPAVGILGSIGAGALFYYRAWSGLEGPIQERSIAIDKTLPDLIDLFANACAAGTTFDMAADFILYQLPETKITTPIRQDMLAWQQDIKFGVERQEAWQRLHGRSRSKNMKYFCNLIDQSEQTGGSIAEALLRIADFFRERRKQALEAEIAQLRGKLVVLTILFIVLPILVYMLVPIGLHAGKEFGQVFGG